jgi:hypothetical protein
MDDRRPGAQYAERVADSRFFLRRAGDLALLTLDNDEDETRPTTLGRTALESLGTALDELERSNKTTALITLCIGGGMGIATIIERV